MLAGGIRQQVKNGGIHAIAQACGRRPILENVPEVCVTLPAADFRADAETRSILMFADGSWGYWYIKTRPSGAGIKFCFRPKQRLHTAGTTVETGCFGVPVFSRKGPFSTRLTGNLVLFRRKCFLPLFV